MGAIRLDGGKRYYPELAGTVNNRAVTLTEWLDLGEGIELIESPVGNAPIIRPYSHVGTVDVDLRIFGLGTGLVYVNGDVPLGSGNFTTLGGLLVGTGTGTFLELLPTGSGQTLQSDAAEPSGLKWVTPSAANSNRYLKAGTTNYTAYYCANLASGVALTTKALVANRIYAMPYVAPDRGGTLDELEVYVTTGVAATNLRIGVYANDSESALYPGALLIDGGAFTSTTSSQKRTASISQALTPGELYWFSVLSDGAPTIRGGSTNQASHLLGTASSANTTYTTHLYANQTYGALPSTFPTAGATAATGSFPGVFFRMSA